MSKRTFTACYIHLIWGTYKRQPFLATPDSREKVTRFLIKYLKENGINRQELFVNSDHVHLLIEFPTDKTIQDIVKLAKGSSSHWINQNDITREKFS